MRHVVEMQLGTATARLYARIQEMIARVDGDAADLPVRAHGALRRLGLQVLCGEYHDYRSGGPMPKADLVEALRAVPAAPQIAGPRDALLSDVLAGKFADGQDEARKWVAKLVPEQRRDPLATVTPQAVELSVREHRVFIWLYRFVEVYGHAPLVREIADGIEIDSAGVISILRDLERKGAATNIGGRRGWLPMRAP